MLTWYAWVIWCELIHGSLYDFMTLLFDVDPEAYMEFNRGFDSAERAYFDALDDADDWS